MQRVGIRPDAIAYIAIIEALYESGVVLCQLHAANLYREALQKKIIQPPFTIIDDACKLVMSTSSAPLAMLNFYCSLADLRYIIRFISIISLFIIYFIWSQSYLNEFVSAVTISSRLSEILLVRSYRKVLTLFIIKKKKKKNK